MIIGLANSGGGFKGALQLGSTEEIVKSIPNGKFDVCTGISTGALNSAMTAAGKLPLQRQLWESVRDSQGGNITADGLGKIEDGKLGIDFAELIRSMIAGVSVFNLAGAALGNDGKKKLGKKVAENAMNIESLLDNTPLFKLLTENIQLSDFSDTEYAWGSVSLQTGEPSKYRTSDFFDNTELHKGILSSATMPVIWPPVWSIQSRQGTDLSMVDGGLHTISPIGMIFDYAQRRGDDDEITIFINHCNAQKLAIDNRKMNAIPAGGRSIDILLHSLFVRDVKESLWRNKVAHMVSPEMRKELGISRATFVMIEPETGDSGGTLDATPKMINYRLELGKTLAQKAIKKWQSSL